MRTLSALLVAGLVVGCGAKDAEPAPETPAVAATVGKTLADFAGTWNLTSTIEGAADPVKSSITGGADFGSWSLSLEGRQPIPLEVAVHGDSMITESGEYESILRKGVMVRVRTATALQDGMMMGTMVATYRTTTGEDKVNGVLHGVRAPE